MTRLWQVVCSLISEKRITAFFFFLNEHCSLVFVKVDRDNDKIKHKYMINLFSVEKLTFFFRIGGPVKYLPRT